MPNKKIKKLVLHWHRRLGVVSAIFVILLSVTGFLLNHSHQFGLDQAGVESPWLLSLYGIEPLKIKSFKLDGGNISQRGKQIFYNDNALILCDSDLVGAVKLKAVVVVACQDQFILFTESLELIESMDSYMGLPSPLERIGTFNNKVFFTANHGQYQANFDEAIWPPMAGEYVGNVKWVREQTLITKDLQRSIESQSSLAGINFERLIMDVHAGRFLGVLGPFIMDVVAFFFVTLAVTGLYIWVFKQNKKK